MRTSSEKRSIGKYRPQNVRPDIGYGSGTGRADELPPLTERRAKEFAWAEQHLPAEHTGLVVSALISLELAKEKQTTKTVLARLEAQGRTAKQMGEKGWL
jgi:hypothetical protein